MTRGITGARRYLLYVQQQLGTAVREGGFTGKVTLNPDSLHALEWWSGSQPWERNGSPVVPEIRSIQASVRSDAATETLGWGGVLSVAGQPPVTTRGFFTAREHSLHINALELLGCWKTIRALLPVVVSRSQWHQVHLSCELDNTVAIKYATVANSRSLKMSKVGAQFFDWRERHQLQLSCRHIRGVCNTEADALSRYAWTPNDWRLDSTLLHRVLRGWHCKVKIDLFASKDNAQTPSYYSWEYDSDAVGVDSLSHAWHGEHTFYAYPPQALIPRTLQKVIAESVFDLVLVTPLFPYASWWPTLMQVSTAVPVVLPCQRWVTTDPAGDYSWRHKWPLVVWRVSGHVQYARDCRRSINNRYYYEQIKRQVRSVLRGQAMVRHEAALIMAVMHDA
jgi:hypothetical protein